MEKPAWCEQMAREARGNLRAVVSRLPAFVAMTAFPVETPSRLRTSCPG